MAYIKLRNGFITRLFTKASVVTADHFREAGRVSNDPLIAQTNKTIIKMINEGLKFIRVYDKSIATKGRIHTKRIKDW